MAAGKKNFRRSDQSDVDRTETLMEFSIAFFSDRDKSKSVENVYNVSVTSVALSSSSSPYPASKLCLLARLDSLAQGELACRLSSPRPSIVYVVLNHPK